MERLELQNTGTIILTGLEPDVVLQSIKTVINEHAQRKYLTISPDYTITDTS